MKSVAEIRDNNLCCSCGICKNVCPANDQVADDAASKEQ